MAVFSMNYTVGKDGLCSALIVFGAVLRPTRLTPAPTQLERACLIEQVMKEIEKKQARRGRAFGLRHNENMKGKDSLESLRNFPVGTPLLLYQTVSKTWEGPFTFIQVGSETVVVQKSCRQNLFRSFCVKPSTKSKLEYFVTTNNSRETKEPSALNESNGSDTNERGYVSSKTSIYPVDKQ